MPRLPFNVSKLDSLAARLGSQAPVGPKPPPPPPVPASQFAPPPHRYTETWANSPDMSANDLNELAIGLEETARKMQAAGRPEGEYLDLFHQSVSMRDAARRARQFDQSTVGMPDPRPSLPPYKNSQPPLEASDYFGPGK